FEHVADAGARFDTGAGAGGHEHHLAAAVGADDAVRNRGAAQRHFRLAFHALLGVLGGLFDRRRNFVRLAVAVGGPAVLVADDDQRVEAEAAAALDHGGATANLHDALFQTVLPAFTFFGHGTLLQTTTRGNRCAHLAAW